MKHLRIKNRGRFITSMCVIILAVFCIFNVFIPKAFSYQEPRYNEVIVSNGDTLWSIASKLDGNINENIFNIQKLNNLSSCDIYIGQTLLVPAI